jgi:hypothetical protein
MMIRSRSLLAALAVMALPVAVHAEQMNGMSYIDGSSLTWNVVQLTKSVQTAPQESPRSWFQTIERKPTARMGLYLAPAYTLPRSVVGWDNQQDIASRVRYGIYLINRF